MRTWVEIRGHRYCPRCAERPRCSACGLPEPGLEYPDGRHICDDCHRTAVINPDQAERIFREVRARIRRELGLGTDHPITFELVSRSELAQRGGGDGQRELGLFRHESERETVVQVERDLLGRETSRRVVEERVVTRRFVDVLYGLPRTRFAGVVAHELAHDIEHERFPGLPRQLSEGWAELVAHRTHSLYQAPEWNQLIEENLDPIYGDGFRRVRDEERRRGGLDGLMVWLATQASEASE